MHFRSRKNLPSLDCGKQRGEDKLSKETKKLTPKHEDAMTAEVLQELKSMRNDLTGQMKKVKCRPNKLPMRHKCQAGQDRKHNVSN